jgi:hypothetical protein
MNDLVAFKGMPLPSGRQKREFLGEQKKTKRHFKDGPWAITPQIGQRIKQKTAVF